MYWNFDDNLRIHAAVKEDRIKDSIPVVLIHGFSGCAGDWKEIAEKFPDGFFPLAIDLPGHGESGSPESIMYYTAEGIIGSIKFICDTLQINKAVLLGYSMGGRAALSFAAKYPERVKALILESASAGLTGEAERQARKESDEQLAEMIEEKGVGEFTDYWLNLPLFSTQKKLADEKLERIKLTKHRNDKTGLANSLRGFSTGLMPELWSNLHRIQCPVCLITGSLDEKFTRINSEMNSIFPCSRHLIIEGAGHNTHLEKPGVFLNFLAEFLKEIPAYR